MCAAESVAPFGASISISMGRIFKGTKSVETRVAEPKRAGSVARWSRVVAGPAIGAANFGVPITIPRFEFSG